MGEVLHILLALGTRLAVENSTLILLACGCRVCRRVSRCAYLLIFQESDQCGRGPLSKLVRQYLSLPTLQYYVIHQVKV